MKLLTAVKFILIFFLFSRMSCEDNIPEPTFTIGTESEFQINQLYYSIDGNISLLINEIGDSRCPEGAVCIWQGEIRIKGICTENSKKSDFELHSVLIDQQKMPDGLTIQIIDAKPYPKTGVETKPEDLVVTLLIQKK